MVRRKGEQAAKPSARVGDVGRKFRGSIVSAPDVAEVVRERPDGRDNRGEVRQMPVSAADVVEPSRSFH